MELNAQIKKYRTELNLSQEELAEKVYVTRQTISNWENGKSYPDIHSLLLLSSLFNVSLDQLIHYHQLCWWFDFCPIRAHTCAPRRRCLKQLCHQTSKRGPIGYLLSSTLPSVPVCISSLLLP